MVRGARGASGGEARGRGLSVRLLASGIAPAALARLAPAADRGIEPLPAWEHGGDGSLRLALRLDADALGGADRVIPSFSSTVAGDYAFRFALWTRPVWGSETPWVPLARIGRMPPGAVESPPGMRAGGTRASAPGGTSRARAVADHCIAADVDTFLLRAPAVAGNLEIRVWPTDADAFRRAPCLVAISAAGPPQPEPPFAAVADVPAVPVPAISQMVEAESIRSHICSPTSVAMVLGALGTPAPAADVAAAAFCADLDRYGVWPAAVWAASRWGALGCVLALRSWDRARALLANGLPLVLSEAHGPGGLPGSPLPETDGHLLVLRGIERGMALVNDPATPTAETVATAYALADLGRAWLGHGGIAYVFVPPAPSDPPEGRP